MNRQILIKSISAIVLFGIGLFSIPFVASMGISERALANRPHVSLKGISVGDSKLVNPEGSSDQYSFLFYRAEEGNVRAWQIPTYKGKVILPDIRWDRWAMLCTNFLLDQNTNEFRCHDKELQQNRWVTEELRWNTFGKNLGIHTDDMIQVKGEQKAHYFVLNRR